MLDNQIINIRSEVDNWLKSFNESILQQKNKDESIKILSNLFFEDSHWRDILALTWKIQTVSGKSKIIEDLYNNILDVSAKDFQIDQERTPPRKVIRGGKSVIEVILKFNTKFGKSEGIVRLYEDHEEKRQFKAWSFLTALSELNNSNNKELEKYQNTLEGPNWLDKRNKDRLFNNRQPEVIVVGSGQAGLSIAARLKQQDIDTLIVDKNERVGDNWRNRYHSLKLHNQTHVNHLPYMPFPSTWPTYIPKDKLAGWFEYYVESMELNVWTNTRFIGAEYKEDKKYWNVKLKLPDGTIKVMKPKHIVMAVGVSSVPNRTKITGINDYKGKVIHSVDYDSGKDYNGKNVLVYGTGTSAHDVAQDLYVHGANVKIVQRSPSMVVNVEPSAQLPYQLYSEGPNIDDCDLITISTPLQVLKKTHQLLTEKTKRIDKPLLDKLTSVGFNLEYGEENSGWQFKYLTRGGGYYFNVGASDLIADGKIKVIQFSDIEKFVSPGIEMKSGEKFNIDLMVTATGYKGQEYVVEELFGKSVVDKIGPIWGFDDERQELRNMWMQTKQPGLWFHAGSLAQCRIFSKFLALQIKAIQDGIIS
ncbi:NAD(P)/FAD-dependent oxidoreductase [Alphaproteobacteria bacterium]|nr:NAD(P)/FAD-dependent oxidoreductase [Alphaproteobacteria bacterium]MDC1086172.1 NAD(P)/FAD-dependent oxidoreductase [Alphaproteobacteria bacterium]